MSITEAVVDNILNTPFESLDAGSVRLAKLKIIDVIGCIIGGAGAAGCRECVDLVKGWGGRPESTVLPFGFKAPAQNAALVNAIMARSYDYEPAEAYYDESHAPAHISSTIIPAALAVAEARRSGGRELITAVVLAEDFTSRLTVASEYSLESGWDSTGTTNVFGATAAASRLYGLDRDCTLNAFGIALNQLGGTLQSFFDYTHSFKMPQGLAARAGVFSAELAGGGFTGPRDALMSRYGYFNTYCRSFRPEVLTQDLGRKFQVNTVFKPYPTCRGTNGGIDCALEITAGHDFGLEDIEAVRIHVAPQICASFLGQPFAAGENPQISAAFNLRYNIANALLRKSVRLEHFTDAAITDPEVAGLAEKIELVPVEPSGNVFAVRLTVKLTDGRELSASGEHPRGDPFHNPLSEEELTNKFWENIGFSGAVPAEKAAEALGLLQNLEASRDIGEIVAILAPDR